MKVSYTREWKNSKITYGGDISLKKKNFFEMFLFCYVWCESKIIDKWKRFHFCRVIAFIIILYTVPYGCSRMFLNRAMICKNIYLCVVKGTEHLQKNKFVIINPHEALVMCRRRIYLIFFCWLNLIITQFCRLLIKDNRRRSRALKSVLEYAFLVCCDWNKFMMSIH